MTGTPPAQTATNGPSTAETTTDNTPGNMATRPSAGHSFLSFLLITLSVFLVYYHSAAPCAWWGDGLELTCAASTLGIPHPTGYPLYTITGHLLIRLLDNLDPGRVMTLFSVTLLSLSCGILYLYYSRLIRLFLSAPCRHVRKWLPEPILTLLLASGLTFATAFSLTLWNHATFAEVYPLTFFLVSVVMFILMRSIQTKSTLPGVLVVCMVMGLLSLNHYSGIAIYPLGFICILQYLKLCPRRVVAMVLMSVIFLVCLLGYLYLPLRASSNPPLNWGDPSNFRNFIWVISGGQFSELKLNMEIRQIIQGLGRWLQFWGTQWLPVSWHSSSLCPVLGFLIILSSILGLGRLSSIRRGLGTGLFLTVLFTSVFSAFYDIPDIESYFLIAIPSILTGLAFFMFNWIAHMHSPGRKPSIICCLPFLMIILLAIVQFPRIDKSDDRTPLDWGQNILDLLPKNAIILTHADNDIYALWYQQMVMGYRKDVTVFGTNFIGSGWYKRYFEHPGRGLTTTEIRDRMPGHKLEHDLALFSGTILPSFSAGRRIYTCYLDPMYRKFLNPVRINPEPVLPDTMHLTTLYPYGIPPFYVFELEAAPALLELPVEELTKEFRKQYLVNPDPVL
jgi:hypothetical protein